MRARVMLVIGAVAAIGCVVSWFSAQTTVDVAPLTDGQPATTIVAYSAPLVTLALLLLTLAGVCAVLGIARLRRDRN